MKAIRIVLSLVFPSRIHVILTDIEIPLWGRITNVDGENFYYLGNNKYFRSFFKSNFNVC